MILVNIAKFIGRYKLAQSTADNIVIQSYIDSVETGETITLYKLLGKELADLLIAYIASVKPTQTIGPLVVDTYYEITTYVAGDDFTNVGAASNAVGTRFVATGTLPTDYTNASVLTTLVKRYEDIILPFYLEADVATEWWEDETQLRYATSKGLLDLLLIVIYYAYISEEQMISSQSGIASQTAENSSVQSPANAIRKAEVKWNTGGLDTWYAIHWFCKYKYPEIYPEFKGIIERTKFSPL